MDGYILVKIGFRFNTNDYIRWLYATKRVLWTARHEAEEIPRRSAVEYYQLVYRNIISQRYAGSYPAYNKDYAAWKAKIGSTMDFWRLHGALLANLQAFRVEGRGNETAWMGGIPSSIVANGKEIAMYGTAVETGKFGRSSKVKPRPVFWPSALEYSYGTWKEKLDKARTNIKNQWR